MDKHRLAFRRALEKQAFSTRTIEGYVSASGRVVRLCKERGVDLYAGEIPEDLLDAIADDLPATSVRRVVRGAVLFLEFLHERGIEVPLEGAEAALSREQLQRFLESASDQREPFATFFCLLPMTGLSAQDLSRLELDDVTQDERGVAVRLGASAVELGADAERALLRFMHGWRSKSAPGSAALFPSREGRPLSSSTITRRLKSVQKAADLPSFRVSALSELFAVYFQAPPAEHAPEAPGAIAEVVALGPADRQPDLPHMTLGSVPPDDDEAEPRLRLVPPTPQHPPEPEPPRASSSTTTTPTPHPQEDAPVDNDDDDFEDDFEPPPRRRASPPRRRARTQRDRDRSRPSAGRPDPNLRKLLGQQGTVYIRRRTAKGRLADIGLFSLVDFGSDRSINTFIINQLVPTYGPGDYEVYLHPTDTESYLTVPVAEPMAERTPPLSGSHGAEVATSKQEFLELLRYFDERERKRPSESESFREFYERQKMKEELDRLRRENARLASGGGANLPGLPPLPSVPALPETSSTDRQLADRYLKLMDAQLAGVQGSSDPFDQFESMMEFKRRYDAVFGGASETASERDLLDRLTDFLNTPVGQMMSKRVMGGGGSAPRRSPRGDLGDAPRNGRAKPPKKPRARQAKPRNDEPEREPAAPPRPRRSSQRWAPSGVPDPFPSEQLAQAETAEEVLEALVFALMRLNFDPRWHDAVQALLEATVADEREEALAVATSIAGALVHLGAIERKTAELALETVDQRWSTLRAQVLAIAAQDAGPPEGTQREGDA